MSNNFAVSSTDISSALTKQSASLHAYGNDINETISLVTAGTEILTGQAGKVARGLRTTGANIVKIAQSAKELKYNVDGNTKSVELWNKAGTDIRSTYSILKDVASNWDKMTDAEKSSLAVQLAGKNQMDVFLATLSNFTTAQEAYKTALGASGSAMHEQEAYAESLQFKLTALRAEFERLVLGGGVIDQTIKSFVDLGTAILKFANTDVGQLLLVITALTTAFVTLTNAVKAYQKAQAIATTAEATASLAKLTAQSIVTFGLYGLAIAGVVVAVYALYKGYQYLFPSMKKVNEELQKSRQDYEDAKSEVETLEQKIKDLAKAMDDIRSKDKLEITDENELKKLERETAQLQIQLSLARQKKAIALADLNERAQKATTQSASFEITQYRTKTTPSGAYGRPAENNIIAETQRVSATATKALELYTSEMQKAQDVIATNNKQIAVYNDQLEYGSITVDDYRTKVDALNKDNEVALDVWNKNIKASQDTVDVTNEIAQSTTEGADRAQKALEAFGNVTSTMVTASDGANGYKVELTDLNEILDENAEKTEEDVIPQKSLSDATSDLSKNLKPLRKAMEDYSKEGKVTASSLSEVQKIADSLGFDFTDLFGKMVNGTATTEDMQDAFDQLSTVMIIGSGILDNLTEDNADYIQALLEEQGVENAEAIVKQTLSDGNADLTKTLLGTISALKSQAEQMASTTVTVNGTKYSIDELIQSLITASNTPINCSSSIANLSALEKQAWATATAIQYALAFESHKQEGMIDAKAKFYAEHDAEREADATIRRMRNAMTSAKASIPTTSGGGGGSSGGGSGGTAKDPAEEAKKQLEELKKQYKEALEDNLKQLDYSLKRGDINVEEHNDQKMVLYREYFAKLKELGVDYSDEYQDFLDDQLDYTKKRFEDTIKYEQHLIDRQIKALEKEKDSESDDYEEEIEELEEKRDKIVDALEEEIDLREEQKDAELDAIKEEQEALKKKHNEIIDAIKTQIDLLKDEKSANKEAWDEKIAQLEEVNDELEKQKQLEEKLEALEKAKSTRVKVFKNGRFVYDVDRDKVSEAQKNLIEYKEKLRREREKKALQDQRDAEQKNYQERIDALEAYKDQQDKYYDDLEDRLDEHYDAVDKKYTELINALKKQKDSEKKHYDEKIKNLQNLKKETEKEYQDMIDDLNDLKDSYSDALEDMENAQNGFLDASKAFAYDYNKSLEENLQNFMTYVNGIKSGYNQLQQSAQSTYSNISNYSNPADQHKAWVDAGSPSSSSSSSGYNTYGYGDVVTKKTSTKASPPSHASGISSITDDEIAIVGENPNKEIVIGSKVNNGTLMSLNKGTGVINAKSTRTLAGLVNSIGGSNNLIDRDTSVIQTFSFDKIVLPNVTNSNSFVETLSREFNNYAIQYGNIKK